MPLLERNNLTKRFTGFKGQAGSAAITGVLMTMLLLGIISQQFYDYYSAKVQRQFSSNRFETRRDAIILAVKRNVRSGVVLFSSVIGPAKFIENRPLYKCLFNEFGDDPNDCVTDVPSPVAFYFDDGTKFTGSSEADGVCYREDGNLAAPTDTCVFKVWTSFKPKCKYSTPPTGAVPYAYEAACNVGMALNVDIEVKLIDPNGMARDKRTATSYVNINDTYHYGQWAYIAYDFQGPKPWEENWWFWWHGKPAVPPTCPGDPSCPCMDVTPDPVTGLYACGDGQVGFGGPPTPPPPGWDSGIPASTPCPAGQIYRGHSCKPFML